MDDDQEDGLILRGDRAVGRQQHPIKRIDIGRWQRDHGVPAGWITFWAVNYDVPERVYRYWSDEASNYIGVCAPC